MKKILVICSRIPYPLIGGDKIRMFNSLKLLSEKYSVDLLFINNEKTKSEYINELKKYCDNVYNFDFMKIKFIMNTLKGIFINKNPLQVNYYYFNKVKTFIEKNYSKYDTIYCNHIRTTEYIRKYNKIIRIVDFVDSIAMNYEKAEKNSSGLWKIIYKIENKRLKKYEMKISNEFDKSIIISKIDKNYIVSQGGNTSINVVNNYINIDEENERCPVEKDSLCFVGKMNYEPNINAVKYFVNNIFYNLREKKKKLKFYIVGAQPVETVKKLEKENKVIVTGFVNDPKEYVVKSELFIAPMVSGAGVQNKIIEAMAIGKCVVTTRIGAEGLENLEGNELVICNSEKEFIDKIIYLLDNPNEKNKIGKNAKYYIQNNLSKNIVKEKFFEYLER